MNNYFISKDNKSGEIVYLEYDKEGYKVTPKRKKEDAIKNIIENTLVLLTIDRDVIAPERKENE